MRQQLIRKLERELRQVVSVLKRVYRVDMLVRFEELEKEIEVQKAYLAVEG